MSWRSWMNGWAQYEEVERSTQRPGRLLRSATIALVFMTDRPYFRAAQDKDQGRGRADWQTSFDAVEIRTRVDYSSTAQPARPSHAHGLGLFGDTMLDGDLAD